MPQRSSETEASDAWVSQQMAIVHGYKSMEPQADFFAEVKSAQNYEVRGVVGAF